MIDPRLIADAVLAAVLAGMAFAIHYYRNELLGVQAQYDGYKATVVALGKQAEAEKEAGIAKSKLETANVQGRLDTALVANQRLLADAQAARSRRGYLPPVPAGATNANSPTCFDRPKLDAALSGFGNAVAALIGEGAGAVILRDGWHQWFDAQAKVTPAK